MRIMRTEKLVLGHVLARPVLDPYGNDMLAQGTVLTRERIEQLRQQGYQHAFVGDPQSSVQVRYEDTVDPATYSRALGRVSRGMEELAEELAALRGGTFEEMIKAVPSASIRAVLSGDGALGRIGEAAGLILEALRGRSTLASFPVIRTRETRLYQHSLNTCIISCLIGRSAKLGDETLERVACGGLLHDIGMVIVEDSDDEMTRIRQHTLLGYELLKNFADVDTLVTYAALEHHEHQDGTGLPRGLIGGNRIRRNRMLPPPVPTLIGEIVAVANSFETLVASDGFSPPLPAEAALKNIASRAGTHFNREVVDRFLAVTPMYPKGTEVVITNGAFRGHGGTVVDLPEESPNRPEVAIYQDDKGKLIEPFILNLVERPDVEIRSRGVGG